MLSTYQVICGALLCSRPYIYEAALPCGRLYLSLAALHRGRLMPNLTMADDLAESARTGKQ